MPHHHPTDRPLQAGEPIVIDMGARLDGYCSDLTRTFVLGEPDERFWEGLHDRLAGTADVRDGPESRAERCRGR